MHIWYMHIGTWTKVYAHRYIHIARWTKVYAHRYMHMGIWTNAVQCSLVYCFKCVARLRRDSMLLGFVVGGCYGLVSCCFRSERESK